jgi:uncharacterized protein
MKTDDIKPDEYYNLELFAQGMRDTKIFGFERISSLLESLSDVNTQIDEGYTLLMHAVNSNRIEVVKLLIEKGADPNIRNDDEGFALEYAASGGFVELYNYLLPLTDPTLQEEASNGLEDGIRRRRILEKEDVLNEFDSFVKQGNVEVVKQMVANGFDIDEYRIAGTALSGQIYWCIVSGDFTPVITLLDAGADVNLDNIQSITYLMGTVGYSCDEKLKETTRRMVSLLLSYGANVNARSSSLDRDSGATALMLAARSGDIQIAQMLLDNGADPNLKNKKGLNALDYARDSYYIKKSGDKELIKLLESITTLKS